MKSVLKYLILGLLPMTFLGAAELKIEWTDPEEFRDADHYYNGGKKSKTIVTSNLERFFERDARRYLPEGTVLEMTVTELDLAGDFEPWHRGNWDDVRIVKSIYPALIKFNYRYLGENGEVIAEGEEKLWDRLVPDSMRARFLGRSESYPYIKSLVRDWIRDLDED